MTEKILTAERWSAALLDETLFRAASTLSDGTAPSTDGVVMVTLDVRVIARTEPEGLELQFTSPVDGTVTLILEKPF